MPSTILSSSHELIQLIFTKPYKHEYVMFLLLDLGKKGPLSSSFGYITLHSTRQCGHLEPNTYVLNHFDTRGLGIA